MDDAKRGEEVLVIVKVLPFILGAFRKIVTLETIPKFDSLINRYFGCHLAYT
jgi:hypothetical protein